MAVQSEHTGSGDISNRVTESLLCSVGEIIVLRVEGELDLCTLPILRAALDDGLDQHPAHLVQS